MLADAQKEHDERMVSEWKDTLAGFLIFVSNVSLVSIQSLDEN